MALSHPDLWMMNPGKKDTVYVRKVDRKRRYEPNRYLSWPIRDILNILDMSHAEESYVQAFDDKLSIRMLHFSMNISNTYTTNLYHTTHTCVKFVKTQFFCPKEFHVYFHLISLPILTQLQAITL